MDFFGIGNAIKGAIQIYYRGSRQTGRTTNLLDSLKDGDRVYVAGRGDAKWLQDKCKERNLNIECVSIPVKDAGRVFDLGTSQGRAVFDHNWVEEYYLNAIEQAAKDIAHLEKETGGYGDAHRETKRQAAERMRWQF